MASLRERMITALQLSGKGERTQQSYVREVRLLAQFYGKSPGLISKPELQTYFLHRKNVDHLAPASMRICYSAIRFFYQYVLKRDWHTLSLIRAQTEHRLPAVLSIQEVRQLLKAATPGHNQVYFTTVYSLGLRLHEALYLQVADIDGQCLQVHVHSNQRIAYAAMFKASATALKRLAKDERFIGTNLPGFTAALHTWGRQLQYHPHIHYIVPGGGLSKDHAEWRPSRANFFVPVKALSPIYRAVFKEQLQQAGLLACIDPQAWNIPWNVHSQARPNGHTAFKYLAPYVFKIAISNSRIVSLKGRTVTFSYRKPGSSRPRATNLDVLAFIRRFLHHVPPDGLMKVRYFGFMNACCAIKTDAIRMMIARQHHTLFKPTHVADPTPFVAACPTCGGQMRVVMRLWTANRAFLDTG